MEDFCKYLSISRTFSLICCMFWIFSPAEGNNISEVVGNKVTLHCKNESNGTLLQLAWKRNGVSLFTFKPQLPLYISPEAQRLNINISESHLYTLVIERVQTSHTGNYTCEISTDKGTQNYNWELIITEPEESGHSDKLVIVAATVVPAVCFLIFILALTILQRVCRRRAANHSPSAEMQEREECIYENCFEANGPGYNQPNHYKHRAR